MSSTGSAAQRSSQSTSDASAKAGQAADQAQEKLGQASDKASELKNQATDKASELKDQATDKADQGLEKASGGLSTAADKLREQSGEGGPLPAQAGMVADRLEQVSGYLKDKDTNEIISDLEAFVREKPVESVIGAVAIGFILAKILR